MNNHNLTEVQEQFINSLPDNKKYYRSCFMFYDILTEDEYNKLPEEKELIYHIISRDAYIKTCYSIANREMPPCVIDRRHLPDIDTHKWRRINSISTPLALKIF